MGELRLGAHLGSRPVRVGAVEPGPPGDGQARHVADVRQRELLACRERMPRGQERDLALDEQVLGVEPGQVVERPVHERHVGAPVAQQPCLLADLAQEDVDLGRTGIAGERVEEPLQQFVGRPGFRHEHEGPLRIPGTPGPARRGRDRVEGRTGLAEQHLAGVGERRSAAVPVEEPDAEPPFQLADGAGERRLRDPEPVGGPSEVQFLGDGHEVPELAGLQIVHGRSLPSDTRRVSGRTASVLDRARAARRAWIA